jgi:FixJ family two-component response regulator
LISGRADIEGVAEEALRLGATGFLVKPFDVYSLLNRIREQMEGEVRTDHIKQLQP